MTLVRADTGQDDRAGRGYSAAAAAAERPVLGLTVSVVICAGALDRWDDLKQAVISVGSQAADEIVLVIDHCAELLTKPGCWPSCCRGTSPWCRTGSGRAWRARGTPAWR